MYKYTRHSMKKIDLYKIHWFNMWQQDRRVEQSRGRTHTVFSLVVNENWPTSSSGAPTQRGQMRRSSLGSGSGRPGFSEPAALVCFLSSELGRYVPSIRRFFLMTHSSSSRDRLSSDSRHASAGSGVGANISPAMFTRERRTDGLMAECVHTAGWAGQCWDWTQFNRRWVRGSKWQVN